MLVSGGLQPGKSTGQLKNTIPQAVALGVVGDDGAPKETAKTYTRVHTSTQTCVLTQMHPDQCICMYCNFARNNRSTVSSSTEAAIDIMIDKCLCKLARAHRHRYMHTCVQIHALEYTSIYMYVCMHPMCVYIHA